MSDLVAAAQRFKARHPCPICSGGADMPVGRGVRCYGYVSADGLYARCTRPEHAGRLEQEPDSDAYVHRLRGSCRCGETHSDPETRPATIGSNGAGTPPRAYRDFREAGAVSAYDYRDEGGDTLFQVWRYQTPNVGKTFKQARPIVGGWMLGIVGIRRVPYRLPELLAADPAAWVLITEGEKDADRLAGLGFVATTNAMGAGKWLPDYSAFFEGRRVCLLLDNDPDGQKHGEKVGASLSGTAAEVRVLRLPGLPEKGDVSNWLDAGGTPDKLDRLIDAAPPFLSAAASSSRAAESKLRFHSASEIAAATAAEPVFVAEPWAAEGAILEIDGKIKSAGKTTFITSMCRAILDGRDFMGGPTQRSPIVYLSEQSPATFREALRRADLLDRDDFRVLFWHDTIGTTWPAVVEAARAEASRIGARVLVVDTLGQFSGVKGDRENDSGAALEAMAPLQEAAAVDGLAVVILRHDRKSGGDVGDSGRGSSAFSGAVDVVLRLRRSEGAARPGIRVLDALSRFDQTPDTLVIELTEAGYVALGDTEAVAAKEARTAVLLVAPSSEADALREADLLSAADVKRTVGQGAIREHLDAGRLCRTGEGKKGDPFRYWKPGDGEKPSAAYKEEAPAEGNSARDPGAEDVSAATQGAPAERNDGDDVIL